MIFDTVFIFLRSNKMIKKSLLLLALALIVAGGAFAQRVGDTTQAFGQSWRVQELGNGRMVLQLVPSLDGVWVSSIGHTITINGSTGVFTQISSSHATWQDAVRKGFVKVGDQYLRNFSSSGNLRWTGQLLQANYNTSTPDVATGVSWTNTTLTMSADGQTLQSSGGSTFTRRQ